MANSSLVLSALKSLRIADPLIIGEILHAKGLYQSVHSARVQAQKALNNLVDLNQIERGKGYYRVKGCESEYGDHARLLTKSLAELFKHGEPVIFREHSIPEIALRPDALCLLTKEGKGLCFVLEVCHTETTEYLQQKVTAWRNWKNALPFLSSLFKYKIPHFDILVKGEPIEGTIEFDRYIKETI